MLGAKPTKLAEERMRCVVVTTLGLNRFDDDTCHIPANCLLMIEDLVDSFQTTLLLQGIRLRIWTERVFQFRKRCHWPIEGWNIQFVNWLAASGRQCSESAAME